MLVVAAENRVVLHDGHDRDLVLGGGRQIHAGHADRGVAHDVNDRLVRVGQLGAHRQPERVAQLRRLPPAQVAARGGGPVEHALNVAHRTGFVAQNRGGRVQHTPELAEHAVAVDRAGIVAEFGLVLGLPHGADAGQDLDIGLADGGAISANATQFLGQCRQEEFGVAQNGHRGRVGLVEVHGIVGGVDDQLARPDGGRERGVAEAGADDQQGVALAQVVGGHGGYNPGASPGGKLVGLVKGALAHQRGHHRDAQQLGHVLQLSVSLGPVDSLPDPDHGVLGRQQPLGRLLHRAAVRPGPYRRHRIVGVFAFELGPCHVARYLHHHRSRAAGAQRLVGAAHPCLDVIGSKQLHRGLGGSGVVGLAVEGGRNPDGINSRVPGQVQHRHRVSVGMGDAGEGVLAAGAGLDGPDADFMAIGGPRDPVGHVAGYPLLARRDHPRAGPGDRVDNRRERKIEYLRYAFGFEDSGNQVRAGHG